MDLMTKKRPSQKRKHPGKKNLNVWIDEKLVDALLALAKRSKRSKTGEVELALEEYLTRLGCWPPPTS